MGNSESRIISKEPPGYKKDALIKWQTELPPQKSWELTDPDILEKLIAIRNEKLRSKMKKADRDEIQSQIVQLQKGLDDLKASKNKEAAAEAKREANIPANIEKALREGYTTLVPEVGQCYEWFDTLGISDKPERKYIGKCTSIRRNHGYGEHDPNPTLWLFNFEKLPKLTLSDPYRNTHPSNTRNYLKLVVCSMEGGQHKRKGTRRRRTNRAKTNKRVKVN